MPLSKTREVFCVACQKPVNARYTTGVEIYPKRPDLARLNFWKCDMCKNYVGTHKNRKSSADYPLRPLGTIPTPEVKMARTQIHDFLDPIWKEKLATRGQVYRHLSYRLGYAYHSAEVNSIEEAERIIKYLVKLKQSLKAGEVIKYED